MRLIKFAFLLTASSAFAADDSCFLLQELDSGRTVVETNPAFCAERVWPCSTFKIPLAAMAFDSGVLKDTSTPLKWDGTKQTLPAWEQDHDAKSWMKESVVWYSQRLTPQIGLEKIQKYLKDFKYGNEDFSGGLTKAWLVSSLKVSAREQTEFLRRLARHKLKLSKKAADLALTLLPAAPGTELPITGKTGTGFSWQEEGATAAAPYKVGWYVGYVTVKGKSYAFATLIKRPSEKGKLEFAGAEARTFTLDELKRTLGTSTN